MRRITMLLIVMGAFIFNEVQAQSNQYGPKAKNKKPWENKTEADESKPYEITSIRFLNKKGMSGPEAKNYKPWEHLIDSGQFARDTILVRDRVYGPKAKNAKPWSKK